MHKARTDCRSRGRLAARIGSKTLATKQCAPRLYSGSPERMDKASSQRLQTRLVLALIGITLAVFGGVCGHEFVHFDDNVTIYDNPHIKGLTRENLHWMFTDVSYARRYMPLGWLSYAVDYQLFG